VKEKEREKKKQCFRNLLVDRKISIP